MTPEQRTREMEAGRIIWEAASLTPGIPGHVTRTTLLVARAVRLIREAEAEVPPELAPRAKPMEPAGRAPEPLHLQQLPPPGVDQAELDRLRAKYAPPGRRH